MYNVKFLKGTAAQYTGLETKDVNTFYYTTDDSNLYLGQIKLSSASDLSAAISRISTNETDIAEIEGKLNTLLGEEGEGSSIQSMIDTAIAEVKTQIGTLGSLNTTAKDNLVNAINEVRAAVSAGGTEAQITIDTSTTTEGAAKSYTIKQGENKIGTIDIPKDMVVSSGAVETDPEDQDPGTYIVLTLANATSDKIYVNVGTLVDIYTAKQSAAQVQLSIDSRTREISATIVAESITTAELAANAVTTVKIADGNVTRAKLETAVQTSLDKANSALQSADITSGATNGTIKIKGTEIAVKGLASAAYTESNAYDAAGAATQAETNAKSYADSLASNYATAAQGAKADTALQKADIATGATNGTIKVKDAEVAVKGLGTAAYTASTSYDPAGSASTAEANAKSYVDTALTWGTISE